MKNKQVQHIFPTFCRLSHPFFLDDKLYPQQIMYCSSNTFTVLSLLMFPKVSLRGNPTRLISHCTLQSNFMVLPTLLKKSLTNFMVLPTVLHYFKIHLQTTFIDSSVFPYPCQTTKTLIMCQITHVGIMNRRP